MSKVNDIEVYSCISKEMDSAEIYLGSMPFSFHYVKAIYTATLTEGIPFNSFDRVICELLKSGETLSFEDIGDILGMNVYASENPKRYLDLAEREILTEALQSLASEEYRMIDGGDINFSRCKLLPIGIEYSEKGCKFKTTTGRPFFIFYDLTTGIHSEAKRNYEFAQGVKISDSTSLDFVDDTLLKSIALFQVPEIYNPEKQYSFTDAILKGQQEFRVEHLVAITFDIRNKKIKYYCYSNPEHAIQETFTAWFNLNDSRSKDLLNMYITDNKVEPANGNDELTSENILLEEGMKISQLNDEHFKDNYFDEFLFYINFDKLFPLNERLNIYLTLPYWSDSIHKTFLSLMQKSANEDSRFFIVVPNRTEAKHQVAYEEFVELSFSIKSLYFIKKDITEFSLYCSRETDSFYIQSINKYVSVNEATLLKRFAHRKAWDSQADADVKNFILDFGKYYINRLCNKAVNYIYEFTEKNVGQKEISELAFYEFKLFPFLNPTEPNELLDTTVSLIKHAQENWVLAHKARIGNELKLIQDELVSEIAESTLNEIMDKFKLLEGEIYSDDEDIREQYIYTKDLLYNRQANLNEKKKSFNLILDTGIFLKYPGIIAKINKKNRIVVADKVLRELNDFKNNPQLKEIASACVSEIHANRNNNIHRTKENLKMLPKEYSKKTADNMMLSVAFIYKEHNGILISDVENLAEQSKKLNMAYMNSEEFQAKFINIEK